MQFKRKPLFMRDPSWYEEVDLMSNEDPDFDRGYVLTDTAPEEARASYDAFYEMLEADDLKTQTDPELARLAFGDE